jgi:signal transduction histidine kinase
MRLSAKLALVSMAVVLAFGGVAGVVTSVIASRALAGMSEASVAATASRLQTTILILTLVGTIISAFLVWLLTGVFTRPLNRLATRAAAFGETGRWEPLDVTSRDEIGELTAVANTMGRRLSGSMAATDRLITELENERGDLERLVSERTVDLQVANAELREASVAKDRFLASMSHELRTPLNSIIGFSGIMLQGLAGPLGEEQRRQTGMINRSGKHLLALINDVLDLARIDAERMQLTISATDLGALIRETADTIRPLAEDKGLALHVRVP